MNGTRENVAQTLVFKGVVVNGTRPKPSRKSCSEGVIPRVPLRALGAHPTCGSRGTAGVAVIIICELRFAQPALLAPLCAGLGDRVRLPSLETAAHGFKTLKRSGLTPEDVLGQAGGTLAEWSASLG